MPTLISDELESTIAHLIYIGRLHNAETIRALVECAAREGLTESSGLLAMFPGVRV